jgi:hypothetical protein
MVPAGGTPISRALKRETDTQPVLHSNQGNQIVLKPPKYLRAPGRKFYQSIADEYGITDAAGAALLLRAAECVDRLDAAHASIAEHGELVMDRYGAPKLSPACALEKEARAGFLSAMRALNLDVEPLRDGPGRPAR